MELPEEGLWLIGRMSQKLMARNLRMGTAESCTGGLGAVLCTNVPGSSRWFAGAIVAYSNELKCSLLGVDKALMERHGAVSGPVVEAMARGALAALGVDVSMAVSGIAGPDGGTPEKPVGAVWFATAVRPHGAAAGGDILVSSFYRRFPGMRDDVRFGAALAAIGAIEQALS